MIAMDEDRVLAGKYADLALPVHALCPVDHGCGESAGKIPWDVLYDEHADGWQDGSCTTTDPETIAFWLDGGLNVGLPTGRISGIIRLDLDGTAWQEDLAGRDLPPTWEFGRGPESGGLLYRIPEGKSVRTIRRDGGHQGWAILGDGAQTVLPPSLHLSGKRYEWRPGHSPWECPIAEAPAWVLEECEGQAQAEVVVKALPQDLPPVDVATLRVHQRTRDLIRQGRPRGQRSEAVYSVAMSLVQAGYADEEIASVLLDPSNGISERCRERGREYVAAEIARAQRRRNAELEEMARRAEAEEEVRRMGTVVDFPRQAEEAPRSRLVLTRMSDVEPETVSWLWEPYLPVGKLTMLEGDPGQGKGFIATTLAAAITAGKALPDQQGDLTMVPPQGKVLWLCGEDGLGDTIRPRLDAAGADPGRVIVLEGEEDDDGNIIPITLGDWDWIREALETVGPRLVVIDPIQSFLPPGTDMNKAEQVRPILYRLSLLAEEYETAVVLIRHLTKSDKSRSMYRGLGSVDFSAAARSIMLVGNNPANRDIRGIAHQKSSLAPRGVTLSYRIENVNGVGKLIWEGVSDATPVDLVAAETPTERDSKLEDAKEYLLHMLKDGPQLAGMLIDNAKPEGISKITLRRAKEALGVVAEKGSRRDDPWYWRLPGPTTPVEDVDA